MDTLVAVRYNPVIKAFYEQLLVKNELPRGKPRGIKERNPQEHAQQAAGYSSSRESGIKKRKWLGLPACER
jgi:hypothetical protein